MDRWHFPLALASLAVLAAAIVPQLRPAVAPPLPVTSQGTVDLAAAERAALSDPTDAHAWLTLGDAYDATGQSDAAWSAWMRARKIAPDDPVVQARVGRGPATVMPVERAVLQSPEDDEMWGDLGDHYLQMGERDRAVKAYRAALELDPQDEEWQQALAGLGYPHEVENAMRRLLEQDHSDDETLGDLGDWLVSQGRTTEALAFYKRAQALDPSDSEWFGAIARIDPDSALAHIPPDADDEALGDLADAVWEAGRHGPACSLYKRAYALDPADDEWREALVNKCGQRARHVPVFEEADAGALFEVWDD